MKPTIIFLHGGPGFRDYLQPFFNALTDRFNCVFYDQLRSPEVTVHDLLSQLHEIVLSTSGEKILLGHSWGGVLAVEYAHRYQNLLNGLVMMSTGLHHTQWREEYHKELESRGLSKSKPEETFLAPNERELGLSFLSKLNLTFSQETFDHLNRTYISTYDLTAALAAIRLPILNIYGHEDVRFSPRIAKTFHEINPGVRDFEIVNAGHFPFLSMTGRQEIFKILETSFLTNSD